MKTDCTWMLCTMYTLMAFSGWWAETDLQIYCINEETNVTQTKRLSGSLGSLVHTQNRVGRTKRRTRHNKRRYLFRYGRFLYMRLLCKQIRLESGPSVAREMHSTDETMGRQTPIHAFIWSRWSWIMTVFFFIALPTRWITWNTFSPSPPRGTGVLPHCCGDIKSSSWSFASGSWRREACLGDRQLLGEVVEAGDVVDTAFAHHAGQLGIHLEKQEGRRGIKTSL